MFGTHHSKMMALLRHDETAQIIIHTANMIVRDWTNMTQAVWLSPRLPIIKETQQAVDPTEVRIGGGAKFKVDFLNYLRSYDRGRGTCKRIVEQLLKYDFSTIRGSLIASVPGRHKLSLDTPTRWGWPAMEEALQAVPVSHAKSEIAIQISSIATLGPTDTWLKNTFFPALSRGRRGASLPIAPDFNVVFPTPDEIRRSLDGYASGGSIHTKIQSPQQVKQLQYLRPLLCHWANDAADGAGLSSLPLPVLSHSRQLTTPTIPRTPTRHSHPRSRSQARGTTHQDIHPLRQPLPLVTRLGTADVGQPVQAGLGRGGARRHGRGAHRIVRNRRARLAGLVCRGRHHARNVSDGLACCCSGRGEGGGGGEGRGGRQGGGGGAARAVRLAAAAVW